MSGVPKDCKVQIFSDVASRDGLGAVLLDKKGWGDELLEVFRDDTEHSLTVRVFHRSVSDAALHATLSHALRELDPFVDGTRLVNAHVPPIVHEGGGAVDTVSSSTVQRSAFLRKDGSLIYDRRDVATAEAELGNRTIPCLVQRPDPRTGEPHVECWLVEIDSQ